MCESSEGKDFPSGRVTALKGKEAWQAGRSQGIPQGHTRKTQEGRTREGGGLYSGKKQRRTGQEMGFIQSFLGTELSRLGTGGISGLELGVNPGIGGFSNPELGLPV